MQIGFTIAVILYYGLLPQITNQRFNIAIIFFDNSGEFVAHDLGEPDGRNTDIFNAVAAA